MTESSLLSPAITFIATRQAAQLSALQVAMEMTMNTTIKLSPEQRARLIQEIAGKRRLAFRELHRVDRAKQKGRRDEMQGWLEQITRPDSFLGELGA